MTPENQRIAIARACGWTDIIRKNNLFFGLFGKKPRPPRTGLGGGAETESLESNVPDYCNSLDAMHEAEKVLTRDQRQEYMNLLWPTGYHVMDAISAPADKRAEKFIKTLGLWTED